MLNEHDQDVLFRCRRLGHEITFGYCRQESQGKPCRLILDCWWETFNVQAFLAAHLSAVEMADLSLRRAHPPEKLASLLQLVPPPDAPNPTAGGDHPAPGNHHRDSE